VLLPCGVLRCGFTAGASGCDSADGLLQLLDVLQLVVSFPLFAVLLLKFIFLVIVLLGHIGALRIGVLLAVALYLLDRRVFLIAAIGQFSLILSLVIFIDLLTTHICHSLVLCTFWDNCLLCGSWGGFLWARCPIAPIVLVCKDVVSHVDFFGERSRHVLATLNSALLLSCLPLFVFFLFIRGVLAIVVCHVDLISEFDAK